MLMGRLLLGRGRIRPDWVEASLPIVAQRSATQQPYSLIASCPRLYCCAGKPLSQVQLKCETAIFWIAGFETTAHSLAWTVMYISTHPEVSKCACDATSVDAGKKEIC